MFCKKGVLKNFAKFTEKHLCQGLSLIKKRPATLLKRDSSTRVFLWICEISKNTFCYKTPLGAASVKKIIIKKVSYEGFSSMYKYSIP